MVDFLSLALSRMRLASSMLARYDAWDHWSVDVIDGKSITAYFVAKGSCWFQPADGECPVRLGEGDLLMLPRWRPHVLCSSPSVPPVAIAAVAARSGASLWDSQRPLADVLVLRHDPDHPGPPDAQLLVMMFRPDNLFHESLTSCLPPLFHLGHDEVQFEALMEAMRQFVATQIDAKSSGYAAAGHRLAELLLVEILRVVAKRRPKGTTGWMNALAVPALSAAMTQLHLNPTRRWTLDTLAREAGLSRSQFSARFRESMGETVMSYVQGVRMHWAAEQLAHRSATEVAADLAFATPYGFHKAFARQFGMTPGTWRRRLRQADRKGR